MNDIIDWLWRICISFIVIVLGTAFLPSIISKSARFVFALSILMMGVSIVYFSIDLQKKKLKELKRKRR